MVDDEPDVVDISGEDSSSRVCGLTFTHPQEALQYFKPNTYDLGILDIRMPDMTGFKLCREMKRCDPSITTCFLSAFKIQTDEFKSVFPSMDGVKAIIKKSISINELLNEMVTLLKIPAADKVAPE
ncbi:MAG: response regulator [Nitrososphaera sp.]